MTDDFMTISNLPDYDKELISKFEKREQSYKKLKNQEISLENKNFLLNKDDDYDFER